MKKLTIAFLTSGGAGTLFIHMNFIYCFWLKMKDEPIDIVVFGHKSQELNNLVLGSCEFIKTYYDYAERSKCFRYDVSVELGLYPDVIQENICVKNISPKLHHLISVWRNFIEADEQKKYCVAHPFYDYFVYQFAQINAKNCLNVLDINDELEVKKTYTWKLDVPEDSFLLEKVGLQPYKYITIQRGATPGIESKNSPKLWPLEYYEELVRLIHVVYPGMQVVQVGEAENSETLKEVDISLLNKTSWEQLGTVLKNAWLHIDGECGMVHFRRAMLAGPSVVIFGSTPVQFYGYAENINIVSNVCPSWCARLTDKWQEQCAREDKTPVCLYSITPQMVMSRIVAWDILYSVKRNGYYQNRYIINEKLYSDRNIKIDDEYKRSYLENMDIFFYEKKMVKLRDLKAFSIGDDGCFTYKPLAETPAYKLLCGDRNTYNKHIGRLADKYNDKIHTISRFSDLVKMLEKNGYDSQSYIFINDKNYILDGLHRGAWFLYTYGNEAELEVIQLMTLHEDTVWDLFPFDKIKPDSKIIIYGAGAVGESYLRQLEYTQYATVIGMLDKAAHIWNCKKEKRKKMLCNTLENISDDLLNSADYILLSTRNDKNAKDIVILLKEKGISQEKIITRCAV